MEGDQRGLFGDAGVVVDHLAKRHHARDFLAQQLGFAISVLSVDALIGPASNKPIFTVNFKYLDEKHFFVGHFTLPVTP